MHKSRKLLKNVHISANPLRKHQLLCTRWVHKFKTTTVLKLLLKLRQRLLNWKYILLYYILLKSHLQQHPCLVKTREPSIEPQILVVLLSNLFLVIVFLLQCLVSSLSFIVRTERAGIVTFFKIHVGYHIHQFSEKRLQMHCIFMGLSWW